jgi:hypothetical protein
MPPLQHVHHVWGVAGRIAGVMHRVVGKHQVEVMEDLIIDVGSLADHVPKDRAIGEGAVTAKPAALGGPLLIQ